MLTPSSSSANEETYNTYSTSTYNEMCEVIGQDEITRTVLEDGTLQFETLDWRLTVQDGSEYKIWVSAWLRSFMYPPKTKALVMMMRVIQKYSTIL